MNADELPPQNDPYCCPGEQHAISRAVHLGRLAAFYPACRQCPRRDETGPLSPRRVAQLAETSRRGQPRSLFHEEGAGGVYLNDLSPAVAKAVAAAFAAVINDAEREIERGGEGETGRKGERGQRPISSSPPLPVSPSLILAGDGRPLTAELVAAAAEGLRSGGCDVVDIGPSTAPCLVFAVQHLQAAGGVLVGNPGDESHTVGMKFWTGPRPLSAGRSLEAIIERFVTVHRLPLVYARIGRDSRLSLRESSATFAERKATIPAREQLQRFEAGDCPDFCLGKNGTVPFHAARHYGQLRRFQADEPYLVQMSEHYHALRPLRVVVDSASRPTLDFLQRLAATVACEIIPTRSTRAELPRQILADAAHFAACIDGDGETCRVLDEHGRAVAPERLLMLLAMNAGECSLVGGDSYNPQRAKAIILETETATVVAERLEQVGISVARSCPRRADMAAAMLEHSAALGGGPSGRFWHAEAGLPLCDGLMTITRLLVALSRSDEPLSKVLDRDAPFE